VDRDLGRVETERLGDSLWVLKLAGEHDLSTAPAIDAAFERIEATGTTVVVDFNQTSFIDSTVAAALARSSRGGETLLLVVPRGGAVRRTLDLIGITDLLRTFETRDEALQAVPPEDAPPA
jgi:anti-sigma B factor antagonist